MKSPKQAGFNQNVTRFLTWPTSPGGVQSLTTFQPPLTSLSPSSSLIHLHSNPFICSNLSCSLPPQDPACVIPSSRKYLIYSPLCLVNFYSSFRSQPYHHFLWEASIIVIITESRHPIICSHGIIFLSVVAHNTIINFTFIGFLVSSSPTKLL